MKNAFLSIIRHILTAAGAAAVANNVARHPELSALDPVTIAGGVTAAIGALWGATDEHLAEKKKTAGLNQ